MTGACPLKDDLSAYALGKLPRERCEEIDTHLEQCETCQGELATCGNADDTLLSRLRNPATPDAFVDEPECVDLMARVAAIAHDPSFTTFIPTGEAAPATPELGNIGPYQLLEKLGAGGMGTVYKAFHPKLKRVVALKMLPTDRMQDEQAIARFEREMEAVGKLDHAHIVRATDAGEHDGKHFLVMEHVEGVDLAVLVRNYGSLTIAHACEIIRQAAIGLQHACEAGLVHRDIKPSNLMLTPEGNVKILDLGLALLPETGDTGSELTGTGLAMGTLDYMAPEQGGDSHDVDIRADIYSLGATFYKLLTGQVIYSGPQYQSQMQKWKALSLEEAPPIQSRRADIPADLATIVHRMIAREKEQRFQTPGDIATALESFAESSQLADLLGEMPTAADANQPIDALGSTKSMSLEASAEATSPPAMPSPASQATLNYPTPSKAKPNRRFILPLLIGTTLLAGLLLAAQYIFKTPQGTIVVDIDPAVANDVQLVLQQGGKDLEIFDKQQNWTVHVEDGHYNIDIRGGNDRLLATPSELTIHRGKDQIVRVTLKSNTAKPPVVVAKVEPPTPVTPPKPTVSILEELDAAKGAVMEVGEWNGVYGKFTPDSSHLAIVAAEGGVRIVDFYTREVVQTIDNAQQPLAFSHDGKKLTAPINNETIGEWDWRTGKLLAQHNLHTNRRKQLTYLPNGHVAVLRVNLIKKNVFELVTSANPAPRKFVGHKGDVNQVEMSRRGDLILSLSQSEQEIITWDTASATQLNKLSTDETYRSISLTPNGESFYDTGFTYKCSKRESRTGKILFTLATASRSSRVETSADGRLAVTIWEDKPRIIDPETGQFWARMPRGFSDYLSFEHRIDISPNRHYILLQERHALPARRKVRLVRLPTAQRTVPMYATKEPTPDGFFYGNDVGCTHVDIRQKCASISKDGRFVAEATGAGSTTGAGYVGIVDVNSGLYARRVDRQASWMFTSIILSHDGNNSYLSQSGYISSRDLVSGKGHVLSKKRTDGKLPTLIADGRLFSARDENSANDTIFDLATGAPVGAFLYDNRHGVLTCKAVSPGGLQVAAGTKEGFVLLWRLPAKWPQLLKQEDPYPIPAYRVIDTKRGPVHDVLLLHNNQTLLSCSSDKTIVEWELATGKQRNVIDNLPSAARRLAVDRTDRLFAGHDDGALRMWDRELGKPELELPSHTSVITQLTVLDEGTRAVTYSHEDKTTRFWKLPPPGSDPQRLSYRGEVRRIAWKQHAKDTLSHAAILPSRSMAITVHQPPKKENGTSAIRLWDVTAEQPLIRELSGHVGRMTGGGEDALHFSLAVSPDETLVAAATNEHVYVWHSDNGELLHTFNVSGPPAFSPDSSRIITGGRNSPCTVWDLKNGKQLAAVDGLTKKSSFWQHRLLDNERLAASHAHDGLTIWDWTTGKVQHKSYRGGVYEAELQGLLDTSQSGEILLLRSHQGHTTDYSKRMNLNIIETSTGKSRQRLFGHRNHQRGATFFADDRYVLSWGRFGLHVRQVTIRIWDVETGETLYKNGEQHHERGVFAAAVTPDLEHLLSVAGDGTIRKFRLPSHVIGRIKQAPKQPQP